MKKLLPIKKIYIIQWILCFAENQLKSQIMLDFLYLIIHVRKICTMLFDSFFLPTKTGMVWDFEWIEYLFVGEVKVKWKWIFINEQKKTVSDLPLQSITIASLIPPIEYCQWQNHFIHNCFADRWLNRTLSSENGFLLRHCRRMYRIEKWKIEWKMALKAKEE